MTVISFMKFAKRAKCSDCGKSFIKVLASNDPAYCQYKCGARAQPEYTQARIDGTFSGGRGG